MFTAFWGEQQAAVGNRPRRPVSFRVDRVLAGEKLCRRLKVRWKSDGDRFQKKMAVATTIFKSANLGIGEQWSRKVA
jgi:hypothetical protein